MVRSFLDAQILIYSVSRVQQNRRVYGPCMITLREGETFDAAAPGDVARVAEKSKDENLEAHKIYAQKPYRDVRARVGTSLRSEVERVCHCCNVCPRNPGQPAESARLPWILYSIEGTYQSNYSILYSSRATSLRF